VKEIPEGIDSPLTPQPLYQHCYNVVSTSTVANPL